MLFERHYTKDRADAYYGIAFVPRKSGSVAVTAPEQWSQSAVDILWSKYMRKAGVPVSMPARNREAGVPVWLWPAPAAGDGPTGAESDARQVFDRLAGFWTYHGWKLGYFRVGSEDYRSKEPGSQYWVAAERSASVFYDEVRYMLAMQIAAPASPQWFNAGLHWAYGITGDDCGQWAINFSEDINGGIAGWWQNEHPDGFDVQPSRDPYKRPALSACFIQSVADNLVEPGGIQDLMRREALVFKYGGGSGTNWSNVRGAGEPLSGGGISSGLLSFLQAPDKSAGAIKSGGTTRRAARMLCLDDDHPELLEFIDWKAAEEKKVAAMAAGSVTVAREVRMVYEAARAYADAPNDDTNVATIDALRRVRRRIKQAVGMGVPKAMVDAAAIAGECGAPCPKVAELKPDFEGEAYSTVSGQNANNSVRTSNRFMRAAVDWNAAWNLYGRVEKARAREENREPKAFKTIDAPETLSRMAYAAWECGCPGWQYDTTINEWWTCPKDGPVNASNPCSEYMAADDTACNLASLNLRAFMLPAGGFDCESFEYAARLFAAILDITVSAAGYPSEAIAEGSRKYRTLGLGHTNIGALLMRCGIPYDSAEGRAWAGYLTAYLHYMAAVTSTELAEELKPFPRYADNAEDVQRVFHNHAMYGRAGATAADYRDLTFRPDPLCTRPGIDAVPARVRDRVNTLSHVMTNRIKLHGLRNAQLTLLAPNGTIGLLMDCDTTGIEPDFALVKWKKLAGGGYMKLVNQSVPHAMCALGYDDVDASALQLWVVGTGFLPGGMLSAMRLANVPEEVLSKAGAAVPASMKLADCFSPFVIGEDEYKRVGVAPVDKRGNPNGAGYLAKFGAAEQVREWSYAACGHLTVEGCEVLKPEHLPVFDCANRCGYDGKRFLSVDAHLQMMAAVQPVLSGAISKTVNFPADATPDDFRAAAVDSWRLGLKAMAGYRDGSKMSQPLNTGSDDAAEAEDAEPVEAAPRLPASDPARVAGKVRSVREKLPGKVKGERTKFSILGGSGRHKFYLRTGDYRDGRLGEIFIDCHKEGATLRGIMGCFAMAVSIGLQRGVPLEEFVEAFTFTKFEPNGPLVGHDRLKRCDSIMDAIFRELAITYLKRDDLAHVNPEPETEPATDIAPALGRIAEAVKRHDFGAALQAAANLTSVQSADSRAKGYTGYPCPNPRCRAFTLVKSGACEKCDSCGEQSGCM